MKACQVGGGSCGHINEKFEKLSIDQQEKLISECAADATACQQQFGSVVANSLLVKQSIDNALGQDIPRKVVYDLSALLLHQSDAEGAVLSAQFAKDLSEKYGLDADTVALTAGLLASAAAGVPIKGLKITASRLESTQPIAVSGSRAIDKAQSYESGVRDIYCGVSYADR